MANKIGLAFLPRKPAVQTISDYVEQINKYLPEAKILIAMGERPDEEMDILHKNPAISILHTTKEQLDIVAGGYCLLAAARALELDWLFFNTGLLRYDAETFAKTVEAMLKYRNIEHLVFGVPSILRPNKASVSELEALDIPSVRYRCLIDMLINYAFAKTLGEEFTNLNAGMFGVRRDAIKYLLSAVNYEDSSLLCPQLIWYLKKDDNFCIKSVPVGTIHLKGLKFGLEKAARELVIIQKMLQDVGKPISPRVLASDFFAERENWNRWVTAKDQEWFFECVIPRWEKYRKHK